MRRLTYSAGAFLGVLFFSFWIGGCRDDSATEPVVTGIRAAKPGGGDIVVSATNPVEAPQGVTLDVQVTGSGFGSGAKAQWAINGVATDKVTTNATTFISSTELVANITIALDAPTEPLYDVIVTSRRKKGIGTELFTVKPGGGPTESTPLQITFRDLTGDKIVSDGGGTYVHDVCGVRADFPPSGTGDVTFDAGDGRLKGQDKKTCDAPRFITLVLDDPVDGTDPAGTISKGVFMAVDSVESVTAADGIVLKTAQFNALCRLELGEVPGSNKVQVTRIAEDEWEIETQPFPNDVAVCGVSDDDGSVRAFHLPFHITVQLKP